MRLFTTCAALCASALLLCAGPATAADESDKSTLDEIKAAIDELKKLKQSQPQQTINTGALAIESWLLTSTAIESTAAKIHQAVKSQATKVVVLAGSEAPDANQAGMLRIEMEALSSRIRLASNIQCGRSNVLGVQEFSIPTAIGAATAIADLLKTNTELTAISQSVDAKLLAASVAARFGGQAIIPSAAIAAGTEGRVIRQFKELVELAEPAQRERDALAGVKDPTDCVKHKLARLTPALSSFDTFYARVTTPKDGQVPIVVADRLDRILDDTSLVLRVNTETSGGTLLKRTNLLTALGAETAFISGGLVSSYQLTNPRTGQLLKAGVITCRTTLTSLKRVQQGSWTAYNDRQRLGPIAVCSP